MKLFMDADCLIKLTKSGLKGLVVTHCTVCLPRIIEREVVDSGKKKECADAVVVERNITQGRVKVDQTPSQHKSGDDALIDLFPHSEMDAVATDDTKLARKLRTNGIPYILPALIIYKLAESKSISFEEARSALNRLADFISSDEYATVSILLEKAK